MRTSLRGLAGLAATGLFVLTAVAAGAAPAERELLGIRIWRSWREVLAKHGQPTEIEIGAVTGPTQGTAGGGMMRGPMMGGPMMGGSGMMGGGPALPPMGGMGVSGRPMMSGPMMGGSGMMSGPMAGGGGGRLGAMMGAAGMGGSGMGARMGAMMGARMGAGMGGSGMGPSLPGFGTPGGGLGAAPFGMGAAPAQGQGEGEVTWIYKKGPLTFMFLFNKDGRVIQIQEFGYKGGGSTSRGIGLGDPVSKVYRTYGWADSSDSTGNQLTLDYSHKSHVTFQLVSAKVVGITVALTERSQIPSASAGGGIPGMLGGGGGAAGYGAVGGEGLGE